MVSVARTRCHEPDSHRQHELLAMPTVAEIKNPFSGSYLGNFGFFFSPFDLPGSSLFEIVAGKPFS